MDENKLKQIDNIVSDFYEGMGEVHEAILEEDLDKALSKVNELEDSLKHLKQNLKVDEV